MDPNEVRRAWDEVAETYAARRDPDAALIEDLLAELPAAPTVLDVGCGDGARAAGHAGPVVGRRLHRGLDRDGRRPAG